MESTFASLSFIAAEFMSPALGNKKRWLEHTQILFHYIADSWFIRKAVHFEN